MSGTAAIPFQAESFSPPVYPVLGYRCAQVGVGGGIQLWHHGHFPLRGPLVFGLHSAVDGRDGVHALTVAVGVGSWTLAPLVNL